MVRITKQPHGRVDGITLNKYLPGHSYDVPPSLADYLVLQGFATPEMRREKRSQRPRSGDRRRLR
jgi:hypothetical protein